MIKQRPKLEFLFVDIKLSSKQRKVTSFFFYPDYPPT